MEVKIRNDGAHVLIVFDGRTTVDLSWEQALELSKGIKTKARQAEEIAKHERLIRDGAILQRAGWRFSGVSFNSNIQERIKIESAHDRDLRRYMPGGVKGQVEIYPGTIIQKAPTKEQTK